MKTEELYYQDVHMTRFTGRVLSCSEGKQKGTFEVVLDRTAFFPEQGGQKADRGTLGGRAVLDAHIKNEEIVHLTDGPLAEGSSVEGEVDWERRFDFMQQHTGEHMLSGRVHARFGYDNVGFHLSERETTLDFNGPISAEVLQELEEEVNRAIWQNLPVEIKWPEKEVLKDLEYRSKIELTGPVRIVEIPGIDRCACCAPHVESTALVGLLKITEAQNYKGGVRLHICCGLRALKDYREKQENNDAVSVMLSAKRDETAAAVRRLKEKEGEAEHRASVLGKRLLKALADLLPGPEASEHAFLFTEGADGNAMRQTVNELVQRYPGVSAVFSGNPESGFNFAMGSAGTDLKALSGELRAKGFRCGGSREYLQGSVPGTEEEIRRTLADLLGTVTRP